LMAGFDRNRDLMNDPRKGKSACFFRPQGSFPFRGAGEDAFQAVENPWTSRDYLRECPRITRGNIPSRLTRSTFAKMVAQPVDQANHRSGRNGSRARPAGRRRILGLKKEP